jgi:hypothetical protein
VNKEQMHFIVLSTGWYKAEYIHDWMFHLEIRDNKVWVQEDTTVIKKRKSSICFGLSDILYQINLAIIKSSGAEI